LGGEPFLPCFVGVYRFWWTFCGRVYFYNDVSYFIYSFCDVAGVEEKSDFTDSPFSQTFSPTL
jgi:hypothetical protein